MCFARHGSINRPWAASLQPLLAVTACMALPGLLLGRLAWWAPILGQMALLGGWMAWQVRQDRQDRSAFWATSGLNRQPAWLFIGWSVLGIAALLAWGMLLEYFHPVRPAMPAVWEYTPRLLIAGIVGGLSPLLEETAFRGILQGRLRQNGLPWPVAITVQAALFAALHAAAWHQGILWVAIFGAGCILGVLRHFSGHIWPGVVAHAAQNLLVLFDIK